MDMLQFKTGKLNKLNKKLLIFGALVEWVETTRTITDVQVLCDKKIRRILNIPYQTLDLSEGNVM
ncbi:hypothetical protein KUTeg_008770 [Tegillarca granosa]|uniref:Uncharacterized protein n=1 Tax=Tegillarca granosa TaxID=220873 RepID=A0ABQ9FA38_TEGGR|nr:hypothetical protein KUTeg_008770 [Tegillarca granosa]